MQRTFLTLAVACVVLLAATVPASAETWFQLRYTGTNAQFSYSGATTNYTAGLWGGTVRYNFPTAPWGLSFNLDTGTDHLSMGTATSTWWNFNVHRNFKTDTGLFSLYAGWGSANWSTNGVSQTYSQQGLRLGADLRYNIPKNWYLTADFGYGPWGNATTNNYIQLGSATYQTTVIDWRAGVGYMFGPWGVEGGYRMISQNYASGPSSCPTGPCYDHWGGWYLGLGFVTP